VSRCVAVWCRVLSLGVGVVCREFVAACCGVLHCVAVYYTVLHCNAVRCSELHCVGLSCSLVFLRVAVWRNTATRKKIGVKVERRECVAVLQRDAVRCSVV